MQSYVSACCQRSETEMENNRSTAYAHVNMLKQRLVIRRGVFISYEHSALLSYMVPVFLLGLSSGVGVDLCV